MFALLLQLKGPSAESHAAGEQHMHDSRSSWWSLLDTLSLTQVHFSVALFVCFGQKKIRAGIQVLQRVAQMLTKAEES